MDLSTVYMGFELPNPFIVGASPLADDIDATSKLVEAGASAIILRSLFEEQLAAESVDAYESMDAHANSFAEALSYFPKPEKFVIGPEEYLEHLQGIKKAVDVPVIASLNGHSAGGWLDYSKQMESAGADAIELHIYSVPTDPSESAADRLNSDIQMVKAVKSNVKIPVAVKLSPFNSCVAHTATQLDEAGADALVLFNRFYQPDIDIENLRVVQELELSDSSELLLRLRWVAIIAGKVKASLGVTGGVHSATDAIKAVMCGAQGVQLVSALLANGPGHLKKMLEEINTWLEKHEYQSLRQMQGSMSLEKCPNPQEFMRGNYMKILQTWQH